MRSLVKPLTLILGAVLAIIGLLGFFMDSPLFGLFEVDQLHNIIHVASGVVGLLAAAMGFSASRAFLVIFGLVYGAVAVVGFVQGDTVLNLMDVNGADNWLHIGIAAACLIVGLGAKRK